MPGRLNGERLLASQALRHDPDFCSARARWRSTLTPFVSETTLLR